MFLKSCSDNSVTLDLGCGFSLAITESRASKLLPTTADMWHVEVSHESDRYVRIGKLVGVDALIQCLHNLPSTPTQNSLTDWATLPISTLIDSLRTA